MDKEELKTCSKCEIEKDISEFYRRYDAKVSHRSLCKQCTYEKQKEYNKGREALFVKKARDRRYKNRGGTLICSARNRALKKNIEFNITVDDVFIPDICPVLGIKLEFQKGIASDNSPSIDRVDNNQGYIKGNIMVISRRANRVKGDASLSELQAVCKYIEQNKSE